MSRPIPWPTSDRTTESPFASTCCCTACDTAPSRLPGRACSTALNSDSLVTSSSLEATGVTGSSA